MGAMVEGTIHLTNTLHHLVQYLLQVLMAAHYISLSPLMLISGDMKRISSHNQHDTGSQTTQDHIWNKSVGVSHKAVVLLQ